MIIKTKETFFYKDIKDFLTNHIGADRIFKKLTNYDPNRITKSQMVKKLYANSDIEAIRIILERYNDLYLVIDLGQEFKLVILNTPEIMPLKYYQSPKVLKEIRIELGYTQKKLGWKLGFESARRGHTIWEKENGRAPITKRDALLLKYLSIFGELE